MVKFRRGPAAVTGDENRIMPLKSPLLVIWEGAMSRTIRKSEDLPRCRMVNLPLDEEV